MNIVAVIQARTGSTRLPKKVLMDLGGRPLIDHVIERVRAIKGVTEVVLATTNNEEDDPLLFHAQKHGLRVIRGYVLLPDGRNDVLQRFVMAARMTNADVVIRVTGDCPLYCPVLGGEVLSEFLKGGYAMVSNVHPTVDGFDTQIFSRTLLMEAHQRATDLTDRHHVCPWMYAHTNAGYVDHTAKVGGFKLSVDTVADFVRVKKIMAQVRSFEWSETVRSYDRVERRR